MWWAVGCACVRRAVRTGSHLASIGAGSLVVPAAAASAARAAHVLAPHTLPSPPATAATVSVAAVGTGEAVVARSEAAVGASEAVVNSSVATLGVTQATVGVHSNCFVPRPAARALPFAKEAFAGIEALRDNKN